MATILYRDGESHRIEAKRVSAYLANGYFVTREASLVEVKALDNEPSDEDFRQMAKELGISHWHNTSIGNLKAKIEAHQHVNSD